MADRCPADRPYLIRHTGKGQWTFRLAADLGALGRLLPVLGGAGRPLPWDPQTLLVVPGTPLEVDAGGAVPVSRQAHPADSPVPIPLERPWDGPWPPGAWRCRVCGEARGVVPHAGVGGIHLVLLGCWCQNLEASSQEGRTVPRWKCLLDGWTLSEDGTPCRTHPITRRYLHTLDMKAYARRRAQEVAHLAALRRIGVEPPLGPWERSQSTGEPRSGLTRWLEAHPLPSAGQGLSTVPIQAGACP